MKKRLARPVVMVQETTSFVGHRHSRVPAVFTEVRSHQRECHRDRLRVFSQANADASNPAKRASRCVVTTWLADKGLLEDLIERLSRGHGAQALTEEAAVALLFVRRRLGSRPGGLALTDDAGASGWIVEACKEKSVHNDGRGAILDARRRSTKRNDLG